MPLKFLGLKVQTQQNQKLDGHDPVMVVVHEFLLALKK
jgi:hypothetical protein